jgi:serine/threonine protein kinase
MPWQPEEILLKQYEVRELLGEGGMGAVHRVHYRAWNVDLAVKSPRPEIFAKASGKENFIREAETWVKLHLHPHIVSCYYVGTIDEIPRIFAEYVDGGSLAGWIRQHRLYQGGKEQALARMLDIAIQFAISGDKEGILNVWDTTTGRCLDTLYTHTRQA